jgi:hypothetical protein
MKQQQPIEHVDPLIDRIFVGMLWAILVSCVGMIAFCILCAAGVIK